MWEGYPKSTRNEEDSTILYGTCRILGAWHVHMALKKVANNVLYIYESVSLFVQVFFFYFLDYTLSEIYNIFFSLLDLFT